MNRSLFQAVLCFILCPLLTATSVAAEARPQAAEPSTLQAVNTPAFHVALDFVKGRKIQLVAQDPVPIGAAQLGAPFHFIVDKDVMVNGMAVIRAGTPVAGVVFKVNRGSYDKDRYGYIDFRLSQSIGEKPVVIRLGGISPEPEYRETGGNGGNGPSLWRAFLPLAIVLLAFWGCAERSCM